MCYNGAHRHSDDTDASESHSGPIIQIIALFHSQNRQEANCGKDVCCGYRPPAPAFGDNIDAQKCSRNCYQTTNSHSEVHVVANLSQVLREGVERYATDGPKIVFDALEARGYGCSPF